jgi:hypothetical protein
MLLVTRQHCMATNTSAELGAVFECDGGLDEFDPEPESERGLVWRRVASPTAVDLLRWDAYVAPARSPSRTRSWPLVVPVVMAAALAGAAVSWLGLRGSPDLDLRTARPASPVAHTAPPAPASPLPAIPEPAPSTAVLPDQTLPPAPTPASAPPDAALDPGVEAALSSVSRSYRDLDAAAVAAVWPGADTEALAQSFSSFKYQALSFDRCTTRPNGIAGALATCEVSIAAAPKTGEPALQRRRESWTLVLSRAGDRWTIDGVSARVVP